MMHSLSESTLLTSFVVFLLFIPPTQAINRTVGPLHDLRFVSASKQCNGHDPENFGFGTCSVLISCGYEHFSGVLKASLSSGTAIAALLPTILVQICLPPLDLVQFAILSPHRALATCCFSIGLPKGGLFRQLRPRLSHSDALESGVREWTVAIPSASLRRWKNVLARLVVDVVIFALASVMLWRNWFITSFTMVPWRCEYSWLILVWPIACAIWLVIAIILLLVGNESMQIYHSEDPSVKYNKRELIALPYTLSSKRQPRRLGDLLANSGHEEEIKSAATSTTMPSQSEDSFSNLINRQNSTHEPKPTLRRCYTSIPNDSDLITIRIVMPSNCGLRSWRSYEALLESTAVGIYLYATILLTSTLFLNADQAIWFSVLMALCLSAVRILCTCQGPVFIR